jgi:CDP-diacylglycerol---serine O-phosphatidyltransferase
MAILAMDPETQQQQFDLSGGKLAKRSRRRGIYLIPSLFTACNLLCGYYAILAILTKGEYQLDYAARAIGVAIVFDLMDGFMARLTGSSSEFGKNFDSLADVVSFGIAPAALAYAWGIRDVARDSSTIVHVVQFAWVMSLFFAICCAWRLARFNVQGMASSGSLRYFIGMPTPAAAGMVAAIVHFCKVPLDDWRWALLFFCLVGVLGLLMTSTVRYVSFKNVNLGKRRNSLLIVAIGIFIWMVVVYSEPVLLILASVYTASGITLHLLRFFKHRQTHRPA